MNLIKQKEGGIPLRKKTKMHLLLVFILIIFAFLFYYDKISNLPDEFTVIQGDEKVLEFNFPINAKVKSDNLVPY